MTILSLLRLAPPFTFPSDAPMVFLNWDGVSESTITNPFEVDPDATTEDTY